MKPLLLANYDFIMGGGEVLTTGHIGEMKQPHPTLYTIDYAGDGATLRNQLTARGVSVLDGGNERLNVELPSEGTQALVLEAARDTGVRLRGLHPKRSTLEEAFMTAIQRQRQ